MKIVILLLFTMAIPFPLCLFRMKKYEISMPKMILIYFVFSAVGFIGARFGPSMVGIKDAGTRLYGLVIFDTLALLIMSKLLKMNIGRLGDFIAPPIMAVCASSKINCLINNCCKGFVMWYSGEEAVYFPSAILEIIMWSVFVLLLLMIEKRNHTESYLWPILMIWFGIARYLVDFLRVSPLEKTPYFFSMPAGRFWSLVALIMGAIFLYYSMCKKTGEKPKIKNYCQAIFGI